MEKCQTQAREVQATVDNLKLNKPSLNYFVSQGEFRVEIFLYTLVNEKQILLLFIIKHICRTEYRASVNF